MYILILTFLYFPVIADFTVTVSRTDNIIGRALTLKLSRGCVRSPRWPSDAVVQHVHYIHIRSIVVRPNCPAVHTTQPKA